MAKVQTYISDRGEVFEGTQVQLMREKCIRANSGFSRKSGAKAEDGSRWLSEEKLKDFGGFTKQSLHLAAVKHYGKCNKTGKMTSWLEGESETAVVYKHCKRILSGEIDDLNPEMIPFASQFVKHIESRYHIINNSTEDNPYKPELKQINKERYEIKRVLSTMSTAKMFGEWTEEDDSVYQSLSADYRNLHVQYEAKLSQANKWDSQRMREASAKQSELTYENQHGEPMPERMKLALRGQLK